MSTVRLEQITPGIFRLNGELNMYSVPRLEAEFEKQLSTGAETITLDLGAVTRSDSAGLALLVEWWRQAQARTINLQFIHIPAQLREIARVSDLLPILPFDRDKSDAPTLQ